MDAKGNDRVASARFRSHEQTLKGSPGVNPEILETTADVRTEIERPRPNISRLKAIAQGVAEAIQTIGALREGCEALKAALLP